MAEDSLKILIISSILAVAFIWLVLSITINVTTVDNEKDISDLQGGVLNLSTYENTINDMYNSSTTFKSRFESSNPFTVAGVVVSGIFGIAVDMVEFIFTPFELISQIVVQLFGVPIVLVRGVFLTILIISIIFGIWALIKLGN